MNTVVGFKRRKMLLKLKYTNCSWKCLVRKDPRTDFMDFHGQAFVFTSQKPSLHPSQWGCLLRSPEWTQGEMQLNSVC
jgi:hypothetical protein